MIYLFLQAVFGSLFGLCIKWVGNRNLHRKAENVFVVGAMNYIIATITIFPMFFFNSTANATGSVPGVSTGAIWSGLIMGLVYFIAFFFVIYTFKWIGVSATTAVGVLAILLPIAVAAFWWDEIPTSLQVVGILLALAALVLIGWKGDVSETVQKPWFASIAMIAFFLLCGFSRVAQEAFNHVAIPLKFDAAISEADYLTSQRPTFVLSAFAAAAVPSVFLLAYMGLIRQHRFKWSELAIAIGLGTTNAVQLYLVLKCLEYYPGYIVFPVTSAGSILLTTGVAVAWLGERPSARTYVGITIALVALFLLH